MMAECNTCKKEILTKADAHAIVLIGPPLRWVVNCGCYFTNPLQSKLTKMESIARELLAKLNSKPVDCTMEMGMYERMINEIMGEKQE